MPYKAIMLDVDGTLSPYSTTSLPELPTPHVINTIKAVKSQIHIGLATSRPLGKVIPILDELDLESFSILQNGAQIIEARTRQTVWQRALPAITLRALYDLARQFEVPTYYSDFENDIWLETLDQLLAGPVSSLFFDGIAEAIYPQVEAAVESIPGITMHRLSSKWVDKRELGVTSSAASKEKAIEQFAVLSGISTDEIIGVGDGHNDIALLSACGLKVAMGNAVPEVKAIADIIAPSVDEDGVAWILAQVIDGF